MKNGEDIYTSTCHIYSHVDAAALSLCTGLHLQAELLVRSCSGPDM